MDIQEIRLWNPLRAVIPCQSDTLPVKPLQAAITCNHLERSIILLLAVTAVPRTLGSFRVP